MFNITKTTIAAIALTVATAGAVTAENYITLQPELMSQDQVTITTVTADADGFVAVYDYHLGEAGDLLGSAPILEGANTDVIISFDTPAIGDVLAVIFAGEITTPDMGVAMEEIELMSN